MEQFADIFTKIEQVSHKPVGAVTQVWEQISKTQYRCKISGRKMDCLEFFRFQTAIGFEKFIIKVL